MICVYHLQLLVAVSENITSEINPLAYAIYYPSRKHDIFFGKKITGRISLSLFYTLYPSGSIGVNLNSLYHRNTRNRPKEDLKGTNVIKNDLGLLLMLVHVLESLQVPFEPLPADEQTNKIYRQDNENSDIPDKHIFNRHSIWNHSTPLLHNLEFKLFDLLRQ